MAFTYLAGGMTSRRAQRRLLQLLVTVGIVLAGAGTGHAQTARSSFVRRDMEQLSVRGSNTRIAGQIAGSLLAAGLFGFAAWAALDNPEGSDRRVKGDAGYTPNANTAYAAGSFAGSVAAAYVIGRGDGSRGSVAATALGAALATIPLALARHEPYLPLLGLVFGAPAQALGATLGYQLTRRER
jgi:hypothetical protein